MNNKIFGIIVVVVVIAAVLFWYSGKKKTTTSGDVFVRNGGKEQPAPAPQPKPAEDQTTKDEKALAQQAEDQATVQPAAPTQGQTQADTTAGSMVPPASDSIARNPPAGMLFAGTGKFQLYRQGDLTWRLNTDSGQACIIFATDAQWRLPRVFRNGCGRG
jgi:hypothetical protein